MVTKRRPKTRGKLQLSVDFSGPRNSTPVGWTLQANLGSPELQGSGVYSQRPVGKRRLQGWSVQQNFLRGLVFDVSIQKQLKELLWHMTCPQSEMPWDPRDSSVGPHIYCEALWSIKWWELRTTMFWHSLLYITIRGIVGPPRLWTIESKRNTPTYGTHAFLSGLNLGGVTLPQSLHDGPWQ